jgi:hypothetical protein
MSQRHSSSQQPRDFRRESDDIDTEVAQLSKLVLPNKPAVEAFPDSIKTMQVKSAVPIDASDASPRKSDTSTPQKPAPKINLSTRNKRPAEEDPYKFNDDNNNSNSSSSSSSKRTGSVQEQRARSDSKDKHRARSRSRSRSPVNRNQPLENLSQAKERRVTFRESLVSASLSPAHQAEPTPPAADKPIIDNKEIESSSGSDPDSNVESDSQSESSSSGSGSGSGSYSESASGSGSGSGSESGSESDEEDAQAKPVAPKNANRTFASPPAAAPVQPANKNNTKNPTNTNGVHAVSGTHAKQAVTPAPQPQPQPSAPKRKRKIAKTAALAIEQPVPISDAESEIGADSDGDELTFQDVLDGKKSQPTAAAAAKTSRHSKLPEVKDFINQMDPVPEFEFTDAQTKLIYAVGQHVGIISDPAKVNATQLSSVVRLIIMATTNIPRRKSGRAPAAAKSAAAPVMSEIQKKMQVLDDYLQKVLLNTKLERSEIFWGLSADNGIRVIKNGVSLVKKRAEQANATTAIDAQDVSFGDDEAFLTALAKIPRHPGKNLLKDSTLSPTSNDTACQIDDLYLEICKLALETNNWDALKTATGRSTRYVFRFSLAGLGHFIANIENTPETAAQIEDFSRWVSENPFDELFFANMLLTAAITRARSKLPADCDEHAKLLDHISPLLWLLKRGDAEGTVDEATGEPIIYTKEQKEFAMKISTSRRLIFKTTMDRFHENVGHFLDSAHSTAKKEEQKFVNYMYELVLLFIDTICTPHELLRWAVEADMVQLAIFIERLGYSPASVTYTPATMSKTQSICELFDLPSLDFLHLVPATDDCNATSMRLVSAFATHNGSTNLIATFLAPFVAKIADNNIYNTDLWFWDNIKIMFQSRPKNDAALRLMKKLTGTSKSNFADTTQGFIWLAVCIELNLPTVFFALLREFNNSKVISVDGGIAANPTAARVCPVLPWDSLISLCKFAESVICEEKEKSERSFIKHCVAALALVQQNGPVPINWESPKGTLFEVIASQPLLLSSLPVDELYFNQYTVGENIPHTIGEAAAFLRTMARNIITQKRAGGKDMNRYDSLLAQIQLTGVFGETSSVPLSIEASYKLPFLRMKSSDLSMFGLEIRSAERNEHNEEVSASDRVKCGRAMIVTFFADALRAHMHGRTVKPSSFASGNCIDIEIDWVQLSSYWPNAEECLSLAGMADESEISSESDVENDENSIM